MSGGHTPGPWYISDWSGEEAFITACNPINGKPMHVTMTSTKNDARLIAAAPDLLEALEAMLEECDYEHLRVIARSAIAKARGEA